MHPVFVGRVDALFEHEDSDGTLSLSRLPVLGFVGGIGPPLVRHPRTGYIVDANVIPGYLKVFYSVEEPSVFHFCHTGLEGEPEAWKIHYAFGDVRIGFFFEGE